MPTMRLSSTVLDSTDPHRLASFYAGLLGWEANVVDPTWATARDPESGAGLSFQLEPLHERPTWPAVPGRQSMQMHLDIEVADLDAAVARAERLGATKDAHQPQEDVCVMRDLDGHLFCLWVPSASV